MPNQPSVNPLLIMLRDLRWTIEVLEADVQPGKRPNTELRKRVEEANIQETVILAKLAEAGVKI
jgi:hypothetical protein